MMPIVKLGFLGAGIAACHHAAAATALGAEVVVACTRNGQSSRWSAFQHHAPHAHQVADGQQLLDDPHIDAVVACMSWDVMPQWAERLLRCPKPILIEKPITLDAGHLKRIIAAANLHPHNKLFGYNRRYYEPVAKLQQRLKQGGLKGVSVVISEAVADHVRRLGAPIVEHLIPFTSAHTLDLLLHLFGALQPVAMGAYAERGAAAPFVAYNGLLKTRHGVPLSLSINADDPSPIGVRCLFDDGTTWHLSPLETLTVYQGYEVRQPTAQHKTRRYTPKQIHQWQADASLKPGFKEQMAAFLAGNYGPGASLNDALQVLELIDAIQSNVWHVEHRHPPQ
ncbi:MAG: Gfo/Idh/MocA family oxidoreductase [Magnetococcales bacterium]|nr:Gfo/Idh/MocA family oxidoreductase [Magnetococcales bacterium]